MNDPIMVITSIEKELMLPEVVFNSNDTQDIDIMSFSINLSNQSRSPAMIRLRNRSLKPQNIDPILLSYSPEGDNFSYLALIGKIKYGVSDKETMGNLKYTQKVSHNYRFNSTHNVLHGQKDKFTTLEQKLMHGRRLNQEVTEAESIQKNSTTRDLQMGYSAISLQPGESSNFKVFTMKFKKSEGHETVLAEHLKQIHKEEQQIEKMYKNSNARGAY